MRIGIQTNRSWSNEDYQLIAPRTDRPPQMQSVLLFHIAGCKHTEAEVAYLRGIGVTHFTLRLSDSIYEPDAQHVSKWRRDSIGYAEDCLRIIRRFYNVGVLDFVVDNEPNISWSLPKPKPWNEMSLEEKAEWLKGYAKAAQDYADWLRTFIEHITTRKWHDGYDLPPGVRLFAPPIAWTDEWPHMPWLEAMKDIIPLFDGISCHTYWQSSRQGRDNILAGPLMWERFGANYRWYMNQYPDMLIQCNEMANSIGIQEIDGVPVWTPQQIEGFMVEQYAIWTEKAREAGVEVVHIFIGPSATEDWDVFKPTPKVVSAMAQVPPVPHEEAWRRAGGI